jgi:hypothetical protein
MLQNLKIQDAIGDMGRQAVRKAGNSNGQGYPSMLASFFSIWPVNFFR